VSWTYRPNSIWSFSSCVRKNTSSSGVSVIWFYQSRRVPQK
jgi:hypothetical protein